MSAKVLLCLLSLFIMQNGLLCSAASNQHVFNNRHNNIKIRVLLATQEKKEPKWDLQSPEGFLLHTACGNNRVIDFPEKTLHACIDKKNNLIINGKRYNGTSLRIVPKNESFGFHDHVYGGCVIITKHNDTWLLINAIGLEEYVCSVLKTESWPTWPIEVHKVMAIAIRTYAISMMRSARAGQKPYDIGNTNKHQTYTGIHDKTLLYQAVEQTSGLFIAYDKEPIVAMFDVCCGGVIPAHIKGTDFDQAPYLNRGYTCSHCKEYKAYRWQHSCSLEDFKKKLQINHKVVNSIKIEKTDKAGLVQEVHIKCPKKRHVITGKQFYSAFSPVKSCCFTLKHQKSKVHMQGKGMGHHLGLCQWGARGMVKKGFNYQQIIDFYYPGTNLMCLV